MLLNCRFRKTDLWLWSTHAGGEPRRYLIVVARDYSDLRDYLRRDFAEDPLVEVVLDRRRGERRLQLQPHRPEQRKAERRQHRGIDQELCHRPVVIVRQAQEARPFSAPEVPYAMGGPVMISVESKEVREKAMRWIDEAQSQITVLRGILNTYDRLLERVASAERENERLRSLLYENEQLRNRVELSDGECRRLRAEVRQLQSELQRARSEREQVADRVTQVLADVVSRLRGQPVTGRLSANVLF